MTMQRLMWMEFFKLRKRMMTWVVAGVTIGLIILLYTIIWSISGKAGSFRDNGSIVFYSQLRRSLFLEAGVPFSLQIVATFGSLLAIILAAGAAGGEYSWGTVRLMATASSGRLRLIIARFIVVAGLVALLTLMTAIVALAYSAIITQTNGGSDFSFITVGFVKDQWLAYGRTLYVMLPFVSLAFAAAVIGRSTLAGVGFGLGVFFVEPLVSELMRVGGSRWQHVPNYLLSTNRNVILLQNKFPPYLPRFSFGPSARDLQQQGAYAPTGAAIILGVYIVVFLTLAFVAYRRRDITAGTGA